LDEIPKVVVAVLRAGHGRHDMIIGRSLMPLNASKTMESVRRRDDNSRGKVQNVRADRSSHLHRTVREPLCDSDEELSQLTRQA
jgi:hypothetical protein